MPRPHRSYVAESVVAINSALMCGEIDPAEVEYDFSQPYYRPDHVNAWYGSVGQFAGHQVVVGTFGKAPGGRLETGKRFNSLLPNRMQITGILRPDLVVADVDLRVRHADPYNGPVLAMEVVQNTRKSVLIPVSTLETDPGDDQSYSLAAEAYRLDMLS